MDIFFQFDEVGYYIGPTYRSGEHTCTDAPALLEGMWPKREGGAWNYVETHVGAVGYVNGQQTTIIDYGPLPEGWADKTLEMLQVEACARIDTAAEALCNAVVTPGSAQMARYTRKQAQAKAYLSDPAPTTDTYPAIYGEVGITADTPRGVAEAILARAAAWWTYGDAIEQARLAGKQAVNNATSEAAILAAEAAVVWPMLP